MKCLVFITSKELLSSLDGRPSLNYLVEGVLTNVPVTLLIDESFFLDYYTWKWTSYTNKGLTTLVDTIPTYFTKKLVYWIDRLEISENLFLVNTTRYISSDKIKNFILTFKESDELLISRYLHLVLIPRKSLGIVSSYCSSNSTTLDDLLDFLITKVPYRNYE